QTTLFAPALQFANAIALPGRVALGQRQPAGFGKDTRQQHRLVVHLRLMPGDDAHENRMADIGPWRIQREVIIDLARHGHEDSVKRTGDRSIREDARESTNWNPRMAWNSWPLERTRSAVPGPAKTAHLRFESRHLHDQADS